MAATRIIRLEGDLAFGDVDVDGSAFTNLTIYNDGNSLLTVSTITFPTGFSRDIGGSGSYEIEAGGSQVVQVLFEPREATSYGGTITVSSDATSGTDTIECSGAGVALPEWLTSQATTQIDAESAVNQDTGQAIPTPPTVMAETSVA